MRVLLVDDNGHFLEAARNLLTCEGACVVGVASTSATALQLTRELHPEVILVDIDLGEESGFDIARQLASESNARIIFISAYPKNEFTTMIAASPALGFVSKSDLSAQAVMAVIDGDLDRPSDRAD